MRYVLASGSPRRRELLAKVVPDFEIIPAVSEEEATSSEPEDIVKELSFQKASEIFYKLLTDDGDRLVVIGADTVVSYNHEVLGKPRDEEDAARMVGMLAGQEHCVYSGVTCFYLDEGTVRNFSFTECTKVRVNDMTRDEIKSYAHSGEPMDKAGAYGIQGMFAIYIGGIEGDYYNVVGLPIARLYRELKKHSLL